MLAPHEPDFATWARGIPGSTGSAQAVDQVAAPEPGEIGTATAVPPARTGIWINIHADPQVEPADEFDRMKALVEKADSTNHLLTLLLSAPWLEFFLDSESARGELTEWIGHGHMIGFHHHDVTHTFGTNWDGYHSIPVLECIEHQGWLACQGTQVWSPAGFVSEPPPPVSDAYALLEELRQVIDLETFGPDSLFDNRFNSFASSQGTDPDYKQLEWQPEVLYSQGAQGDVCPCVTDPDANGIEALSSPRAATYNGVEVREISGRHLNVGSTGGITVQNVFRELDLAQPGEFVGVTVHAWEYRDTDYNDPSQASTDQTTIDSLLDALAAVKLRARLMQEILDSEPLCERVC